MNLYKIEYNFNEALWKKHKEDNTVSSGWEDPSKIFNTLNTHVLSVDYKSAVEKVFAGYIPNPYLYIAKLEPITVDIRILE